MIVHCKHQQQAKLHHLQLNQPPVVPRGKEMLYILMQRNVDPVHQQQVTQLKQPLPVGNNNNTQTISPVPILAKASTPSAQPVKIQPLTKSSTTSSKSTSKSTKPQTQQLQNHQ